MPLHLSTYCVVSLLKTVVGKLSIDGDGEDDDADNDTYQTGHFLHLYNT